MRRRFAKMHRDHIGAIALIDRSFKQMRGLVRASKELECSNSSARRTACAGGRCCSPTIRQSDRARSNGESPNFYGTKQIAPAGQ
jgi:hypothetical protein